MPAMSSLGQLKVMAAIESCRTAALGGHVERCADCDHSRIAYNSCRNRHCPKCQGAAARDWLAARQADLLPVGYFHIVFTMPAEIADIAWHNKAVIYDLLFRASSEAMLTIAADPKHLGARIGFTAVLHSVGIGHDPPSAYPHDRPRRRDITGRNHMGALPARLPLARTCALPACSGRLMLSKLADAHQRRAGWPSSVTRAHLGDPRAFAAFLAPLKAKDWFVYAKPLFAGPEAVLTYLSRYTHRVAIANSRLISPRSRKA